MQSSLGDAMTQIHVNRSVNDGVGHFITGRALAKQQDVETQSTIKIVVLTFTAWSFINRR